MPTMPVLRDENNIRKRLIQDTVAGSYDDGTKLKGTIATETHDCISQQAQGQALRVEVNVQACHFGVLHIKTYLADRA